MPTLDWIGKKAVVNHHRDVPYRLIHCDRDKSHGDPDAGNLLVQGDNLEALKALLPYYAGKVKCIYIDPPYNTGNESWVYNDNVNSPEIRAWLGSVVGKEAEDLSRHDKWLCMMYPRLRLLKEFLDEDGFIIVSIDDVELAKTRLLMDEIFGQRYFVACFVWKSRKFLDSRSTTNVSNDHEYILVYRASEMARLRGTERDESKFSNPDNDPRGLWMSRSILGLANPQQRPNLHYDIVDPSTGNSYPPAPDKGWRYGRDRMELLISEGRILFPKNPDGRPREKKFKDDLLQQFMGISSVIDDIHTSDGSDEIRRIFGGQVFDFPKPSELVARFFEQAADEPCLFLDSFAGSGTSGHAALNLKKRGLDCRFILVEMDKDIADSITRERLKRVIDGFSVDLKKGDKREVEGTGGGFRFCTLGEPLFDADGNVSPAVTYPDLAAHVFFCETGSPIPKRADGASPLIGKFQNRAIYLLHSAEAVGVAREQAGNVLTGVVLEALPLPAADFTGARIVYAEGCTVPDDRLSALGVTFKQIPYQIEGI
ncbi:site-specific DNA-methyltransferase [Rhizobium sp. XQZ8]|uniref:site-specific DNA-methyltransferase n=1 Tax=Rhizobium populisoli TaxID=2859785 RepID=UPI001CA5683B|nr:site-specific DNA-methyltransferase [Rhizobium populisoli]MBW6426204.1 site-specific DNA-methyltransferase [Rhizobium populisoli]